MNQTTQRTTRIFLAVLVCILIAGISGCHPHARHGRGYGHGPKPHFSHPVKQMPRGPR